MAEVKHYLPQGISVKFYADDILLISSGKYLAAVRARLQKAVSAVEILAKFNGFKLASNKSQILHVCRRIRGQPQADVITETVVVASVTEARLLGVTIDRRFRS